MIHTFPKPPVVVLILLLLPTILLAQEYSLDQCIEEALATSHLLLAGHAEADAARAAREKAEAELWPVLGLTGSYSWVSETMELNLSDRLPIPGLNLPSIEFGDGTTTDLALAAQATLYAGGAKRAAIRANRASEQAAHFEIATDSLELVKQVQAVYYRTLGAQAGTRAASSSVARLERHLASVRQTRENGMATREAELLFLSHLQKAKQAFLNAELEASSSRLLLGLLTGHPGEEIHPVDNLEQSLLPVQIIPDLALATRPEIAVINRHVEMLDHTQRAVKGSYLPKVDIQGAYHYGKPGVDMIAGDWMDYATIGVNLSWVLWDWGGRSRQLQQVKASQRALSQSRAGLEKSLTNQYIDARNRYQNASDLLSSANDLLVIERERYSLVQSRYDQGMATETELLDAQDDLTLAEIELAVTTAGLRMAEVNLIHAAGN